MNESVNSGNHRTQGPSRFAAHNVVATFDGPEQARAALVLLERKGVEANDIELFGPGMARADQPITNDEQHDADVATFVAIEKRGVTGILIGAVVGATVGAVIAAVASGDATPIVAAAVAGALLVGALGFLWGGFSGMGASEQWGETFESEGGVTSLAVHSDDPAEVETAIEALKGADARRLATCGPDGQLRDVA